MTHPLTDKYYDTIQKEVPQGWMLKEKMEWMEKIYSEIETYKREILEPCIAVECGVFYGQSAIAQALIIKELNLYGQLYAIDAWSAEASAEGTNSEANKDWWTNNVNYEHCYNSFQDSIRHFGVGHIVSPIKMKSEHAASLVPQGIDVLHLDSNHCKEVISMELALYVPKMKQGAYLIADDFFWEEAKDGYAKIPDYGFKRIHVFHQEGQSFAIFQKL